MGNPAAADRRSAHSEQSYNEISVLDEMTDDEEGQDDEEEAEKVVPSPGDESSSVSLDDLLQEKNSQIEALERANRIKDEKLQLLQQKLNDTKTKHKEGIYWLQSELANARRENDATEEQMAELMTDLQAMTKIPNPNEVSEQVLRDATIQNYEQTIASLENQITMMKTSAGEVVKTLKEEIADLMEDRATMEVDLLNQLAALDNQKSMLEAEFEHQLKLKNDAIQRLLSAGGTATTSAETADMEEYEAEIGRLMEAKKKADSNHAKELLEAEGKIQMLELANAQLKADLDRAEEDMELFKSESNAEETIRALQFISQERQETVQNLESVAAVWEKADAAILALEDTMDQLRPDDDVPVKGDRERLLSTLETAALVHVQVKVSLMLIELKFRNQLESLKNDKLSMKSDGPTDEKVIEHMKSIQTDVLKVLTQVETTLSGQIREMEKRALEETKLMKDAIQKRSSTLETMQTEHRVLEEEIKRLKSSDSRGTDNHSSGQREEETKSASNDGDQGVVLNGISKAIFDQLQMEVLRIVERVKEKNEVIEAMKVKIEDHKATEERLKKELKRAVRKTPSSLEGDKTKEVKGEIVSPRQSPKETVVAAISPLSPPPRSPTKASSVRRRASAVDPPFLSPKQNVSSILPLAPSPREISRARMSMVLSPTPLVKTRITPKSNSSG